MSMRTSWRFYWGCESRMLASIAMITVAAVVAAIATCRTDWLTLGGGVLTLIGIPLTAWRILRRGPAGSLDSSPPATLPTEGRGRLFNPDHIEDRLERIRHNFAVISGVVALAIGTILDALAAPLINLLGLC